MQLGHSVLGDTIQCTVLEKEFRGSESGSHWEGAVHTPVYIGVCVHLCVHSSGEWGRSDETCAQTAVTQGDGRTGLGCQSMRAVKEGLGVSGRRAPEEGARGRAWRVGSGVWGVLGG